MAEARRTSPGVAPVACRPVLGGPGPASPATPATHLADLAILLLVAGLAAAVYIPMLATGERLSANDDFLQGAARHEAMRQSLFLYGAFPLRTHAFGSGFRTLGDPEDPALNPLAWCLLPFSSVVALKVRYLLAGVVAAGGTYLLARGPLGYTRWGSAFSALVFALSFWLPWQIESGNTNEMYVGFVPLALYLLLTAAGRPLRLAGLVALLYTMLSDGKLTFFSGLLFAGLALSALAVFGWGDGARSLRGRLAPLGWLVVALGLTCLVGMPRILPALETESVRGWVLTPGSAAWDPRAEWKVVGQFPTLRLLAGQAVGLQLVCGNCRSVTVGLLPVILFMTGAVLAWRRVAPWLALVAVLTWLALGPRAPVNLLAALRRLPVYGALDDPAKYLMPLISLGLCLGAGAFFGPVMALRSRRVKHLLAAAATGGAVLVLAPEAVRVSTRVFSLPPPGIRGTAYGVRISAEGSKSGMLSPESPDFYSVAGHDLLRKRAGPVRANAYLNLLRRVGTIDFYTPVPQAERGQPRYFVGPAGDVRFNPDYRGEAHFQDPRNRCVAHVGPTRIRLEVDLETPDTLVINQNFDPNWRVARIDDRNSGDSMLGLQPHPTPDSLMLSPEFPEFLGERDGLLALRLNEPGRRTVVLRYSSQAFNRGLMIGAAGLAGFAVLALLRRHLRRARTLREECASSDAHDAASACQHADASGFRSGAGAGRVACNRCTSGPAPFREQGHLPPGSPQGIVREGRPAAHPLAPRGEARPVAAWVLAACVGAGVLLPLLGLWPLRWSPFAFATDDLRYTTWNDVDAADPAYRRSAWAEPGSAENHYNRALALEARGETAEALDEYREVARLRPADEDVQAILHAALQRARARGAGAPLSLPERGQGEGVGQSQRGHGADGPQTR